MILLLGGDLSMRVWDFCKMVVDGRHALLKDHIVLALVDRLIFCRRVETAYSVDLFLVFLHVRLLSVSTDLCDVLSVCGRRCYGAPSIR